MNEQLINNYHTFKIDTIEVVPMTYHLVNMADYSNAFNKSIITTYRDSTSHMYITNAHTT